MPTLDLAVNFAWTLSNPHHAIMAETADSQCLSFALQLKLYFLIDEITAHLLPAWYRYSFYVPLICLCLICMP